MELFGVGIALTLVLFVGGQDSILCNSAVLWPRQPLERTIVGQCRVDLGKCPTGSCTCPGGQVGYICPQTEVITVDCEPFGEHEVENVTACVCCSLAEVNVRGTVVDSVTGNGLPDKQVRLNGIMVADTDDEGRFSGPINQAAFSIKLVIVVSDESGIYADAVRVFEIQASTAGPINVKLAMMRRADPVRVNPAEGMEIPLGEDSQVGSISILPNRHGLRYENGEPLEGLAFVSVTFAGASQESSEDNLQGRFLTSDGEPLASDGMLTIDMRDASGNRLTGSLLFQVREGMKLWLLNSETGSWDALSSGGKKRRRRQTSMEQILALISSAKWINIDRTVGWPTYYYKARVIYEEPADALNGAFFMPNTLVYTPQNTRLQIYNPGTHDPDTVCFSAQAIAYDPASPSNVCIGLISLKSQENIVIGGHNIFHTTQLLPKALSDYTTSIQTAHNYIDYAITPEGYRIFLRYKSSPTGGIYETESACVASTITDPAFHFLKPRLPSYLPYPGEADLCTARIHFAEEAGFHAALASLATLPTVYAISTWVQTGSAYYYTDTTTMQYSAVDNFYFACVIYRCSENTSMTDVHIVIDVPDVINPSTNATEPLFECQCKGLDCTVSVEGSSFQPRVLSSGAGPDLFTGTVNDCPNKNRTEEFAHTIYCWDSN